MHWYCVHTKPTKEEQAARYLQDVLGLERFLPRLRQRKTIRRVRRVVVRPLFPRYLFCRFDPANHFRAVRHAPEVLDIVSYGGRPTVVDDSLVTDLQSWSGDSVDVISLLPELQAGDRVEITDGPLKGLHASVLFEMTDRERVAVLLDLLDCGARATLDRSQLKRTG